MPFSNNLPDSLELELKVFNRFLELSNKARSGVYDDPDQVKKISPIEFPDLLDAFEYIHPKTFLTEKPLEFYLDRFLEEYGNRLPIIFPQGSILTILPSPCTPTGTPIPSIYLNDDEPKNRSFPYLNIVRSHPEDPTCKTYFMGDPRYPAPFIKLIEPEIIKEFSFLVDHKKRDFFDDFEKTYRRVQKKFFPRKR